MVVLGWVLLLVLVLVRVAVMLLVLVMVLLLLVVAAVRRFPLAPLASITTFASIASATPHLVGRQRGLVPRVGRVEVVGRERQRDLHAGDVPS